MQIDRYIEYVSTVRRYSRRTVEIYRDILERYDRYADGGGLTVQMVRNYEVHLMDEEKLSPRTVRLHLSVLSGYCRYMVRKGEMESNPVRLVTRPAEKKRLPEFYREDSMENYFSMTRGDLEYGNYQQKLNRIVLSILADTGMRRSELIGLNRSSFDEARKVMHVKGKGNKMREIPLIPSLCDEISLYLQSLDSLFAGFDQDSPLVVTSKGARLYPVLVDRIIKKELGAVEGVTGRKSPHVLRHTLATQLLGDGADINSIKELLGHSSLAATQVYTHNSVERLKKVYNNAHPRAKKGGKNGDQA